MTRIPPYKLVTETVITARVRSRKAVPCPSSRAIARRHGDPGSRDGDHGPAVTMGLRQVVGQFQCPLMVESRLSASRSDAAKRRPCSADQTYRMDWLSRVDECGERTIVRRADTPLEEALPTLSANSETYLPV